MSGYDATVVGAGPNGLGAAIELARRGRRVLVIEGRPTVGGGSRSGELTLPGFSHDICAAIHPAGISSPFFNEIGLDVEWIHPEIPVSHPLGDGEAAALFRSLDDTVAGLGKDGNRYRSLLGPLVNDIDRVVEQATSPLTLTPKNKMALAKLGSLGTMSTSLVAAGFGEARAKALLAGLAAHSAAALARPGTAIIGLFLAAVGHAHGWPVAAGGSQSIPDALAAKLETLGGTIETDRWVADIAELPGDLKFLDMVTGGALIAARGQINPRIYARALKWRPGPGVFKVDWALDGPIPWRDEYSGRAGTVHVGGNYQEIAEAEKLVARGRIPDNPFVLVAQQSLFDSSRAPRGKHTGWGYCHVPNGSTIDMTDRIESQIERFAPGFKDLILDRNTISPREYENYNPNNRGGDVGGGEFSLLKIAQGGARRPFRLAEDLYLCSSSAPPGAGVHGMCGYNAVNAALGKG